MLAVGEVVEVDAVDLVDHLAQQLAGLHVVVGALEHVADDAAPGGGGADGEELLEGGEEFGVDEGQEAIAGQALRVGGPVSPLEFGRDRGFVAGVEDRQFLILVVDDLEEEQPAQLADALGRRRRRRASWRMMS